MAYPKPVETLIESLIKLPGIGRRSAERIVYWLLDNPKEASERIVKDIIILKNNLRFCLNCNHLSETDLCTICQDFSRDQTILCVVEDPKNVIAIEKSGSYKGKYHVLLGTISPAENRGPEDIKILQLIERVKTQDIKEVVIATDPDSEGEMTSLFITKQLKPLGVKISRIGLGIPMGSSLEYADISTLSMSLAYRKEIGE